MFPGSLPICHRNSRGKWNCHRLWVGGKPVLFHFRNAVLSSLRSVYIGVSLKNALSALQIRVNPALAFSFLKFPHAKGAPISKAWVQVEVSKAACLVLTSGTEVFSFCFQAYLLGNKMRLSERWERKWAEPLAQRLACNRSWASSCTQQIVPNEAENYRFSPSEKSEHLHPLHSGDQEEFPGSLVSFK